MLTCIPGPLNLDPSNWVRSYDSRLLLYNKSLPALTSWKQPLFILFFLAFFYLWYIYFKVPRRYTSGEFWARLKPYKASGIEKMISSALVLAIKLQNNTKPCKIHKKGQKCFAFSENDHFGTCKKLPKMKIFKNYIIYTYICVFIYIYIYESWAKYMIHIYESWAK